MRNHTPRSPGELRRQAEERLSEEQRGQDSEVGGQRSTEETAQILHELRVHQIELELQNEELCTAQAQIDAERARYDDLYDLAPVGYCTLTEQGLILEANLTAAALLGTTRGALVKQPISRFIVKEDQDIYHLHRKKLFEIQSTGSEQAGQPQECELRLVKADGTSIWAQVTGTAAQAEDGTPICRCGLSDITERKQAEEALRDSEALLSRSQGIAHTGSWKLDLTVDRLTWSDEVYRIFGCKPQEFAPTYDTFLDFVHPDDRAAVDEAYSRSVREGNGGYDIEHRIVRRNSTEVRYVHERCVHERDASGTIIQSTGVVQDITERKQAEEKRRHSHDLMQYIVEHTNSGVAIHDRNLNYLYVSQRYLDMYKVQERHVLGKHHYEVFPDLPRKWREAHQKALAGEVSRSDRDPYVRADGTVDYTRWECRPWYEADGSVGGIIVYTEVITDLIRQEQSLRDYAEKLGESEENLRITLNSIGDAVISTAVDGRVVSMNPVAEALTGWSANEAVGQALDDIFRIINERTRRTVKSPVDNVLKTGKIVGLANHTLLLSKDGRETPIADSGAPIRNAGGETCGVVLVFRDQTAERAAERALRQSQERLESMFRAAPIGIGLVRERIITEVNERLVQMTGYSAEELIDQSTRMLYPSQQEYEYVGDEKYRQIRETGTGSVETVWQRKDGVQINVLLSSTSLDPADPSKGVTFTALDITDRKRLQDALKKRIVALTRPLSDEVDIAFDTLFNLEEIQRIQDEFADATGTAALILLPDGTPITEPSNFVDFCNLVRATEKGCANCLTSDQVIGAYHPGGPLTQRCSSSGLWDAGANIMVGGKHIASWLIGQVRDDSQTDDQMRAYAREIGADEEQMVAAFHDVPVMSEVRFRQVAQALYTLANQLSTSAYQNLQQARFISEQKQTERELRRLYTAIEQSPETVVITDTEGIIQYVNPAFETTTGYTCEEAIGQNPRILKSGQQDAEFYTAMWSTLLDGRVWEGRMINKRKDGSLYTEEASIAPVKDSNGTITNYAGIKRDITQELKREEMLRQSQKMESVGRLAGGVAHDFNNLLMGIMGYADICRDEIGADHPIREWLDEIKHEAERSADLTHQLLAFARKQTIAPTLLDLNDAVAGMLKMLRRLIGEDIDLVWQPGAELWPVKIDPGQVGQVLVNLCVNARDAIGGTGKVTIETAKVTIDRTYCAEHAEAVVGSHVMLTVSDDGGGMDEETLAQVFEPFFTTKGVGEGTGLGLATVHGIVKQNNGFIHVRSEPGEGTTFCIYLPRAEGETVDDDMESRSAALLTGNETILLVEDEKSIRVTTARFLKPLGYTVLTAETPAAALKTAAEHKGRIQLLITDVVMPGMSGRDLAVRLAHKYAGMKCLFISGYSPDVIAHRGVLDADVELLAKPFSRDDIVRKVRELLDG